jgi:hypothetical protein
LKSFLGDLSGLGGSKYLSDIILRKPCLPKGVKPMTRDTLLNEEIHDRTDVKRTFQEIREALEKAASREDLTELYKQTVYMILMTHSTPLNEKDQDMKRRRQTTEEEFARTVRLINQRAQKIGVEVDYDEDWKNLSTNGYEREGENLEAENRTGIPRE